MLQERVSIIEGKKPIIFVAPHGSARDDINTSIIAETLATFTNGYAIINHGWERAEKVDQKKDKANCNNIEHCLMDVIKEEFFDPLIRFKNRILKRWSRACIVYLHGVGNDITTRTGIDDLKYIVGWGKGDPDSKTCQKWIKDFVVYHLATGDQCKVGEGRAGGKYAAWQKNNLNQYFRQWHYDSEVDSMQIEIINSLRRSTNDAKITAQIMSLTFIELLEKDSWELPRDFKIPRV